MSVRGFKSITIREELYKKLEELAKEKGMKSVVEVISFLSTKYLEGVRIDYDPRL